MSPMKLDAGGKPWRRKPSARAGGERGQHAGARAVQRQGDDRERRRRDHADARGQPVDAVDEVDHVHHRDDPDHRQDLAEVDVAEQRDVVEERRESRSTPPTNGSVKSPTPTPLNTGITAATIWPTSFDAGGSSKTSSSTPDHGDQRRRRPRIALVCGAQGRNRSPATSDADEDREPAELRRRDRRGGCARSGTSIAPIRRASCSVSGTSSQARTAATANANSA